MSTEVTKTFADRLQDLIADSGEPIAALAKKMRIASGALSKYQNDAAAPSINALVAIAHCFNVSTDWLLGLSNDRQRKAIAVDELGLSEGAVAILKEWRENWKLESADVEIPPNWSANDSVGAMISAIIESDMVVIVYYYALRAIEASAGHSLYGSTQDIFPKIATSSDGTTIVPASDAARFYTMAAAEALGEILKEHISNSCEEKELQIEKSET